MLPSQILEQGWCQRFGAVDKHGYEVPSTDRTAVKHCIHGAVTASKFYNRITNHQANKIIDNITKIIDEHGYSYATPVDYNDALTTSKEEVVMFVKQAEQMIGLFPG